MLRRNRQIRTWLQKVVDGGLFAFAFWVAHYVRANWLKVEVLGGKPEIQAFDHYFWLFCVAFLIAPFLLETQGFYNRPLFGSRRRTIWLLLRAALLIVTVMISVMFLTKDQLARSVILLFGAFGFALVWGKDEMVRIWLRTKLAQAQFKKRLILVGTREETARLKPEFCSSTADDIEIVAELDLNESSIERLIDLLHDHSANGVILSAQHTFFGQLEKAIQACEIEGVEAWLMADFFKTQISQTSLDEFYGRPMLVFRSTPPDSWQNLAKQIVDVIGAILLLIVLSLPMAAIALVIKLTSPGPVLFRQQRSGLNGQPFTMLKFRSMVSNAEQRKQELAVFNEMSGPVFKLTDDPRVTRIGRFLRRWSVDELPQLINVLRGEMSLVGPRPLPVDEVKRFDDLSHRRRLSVKPGLTCLWQVSGRNEVKDFKDWVRLDLEYIDNWSIWLDLKILARTIPAVVWGTGAK